MMEELGNFPINLFDAGVVVVLLVSGLLAYARGFVHEVFSIAGWIGAIFATFYGFPFAQPYARQFIGSELLADLSAGTLIFLVALVVLSMLTRSISSRVKDSALNALDRALGFLFGILRGALIVIIGYIGLELLLPKDEQPEWVQNARSMQLIEPGAELLIAELPEKYASKKSDTSKKLKKKAGELMDSGKVVRDLISPAPKSDAKKNPDGYDNNERQDMERLIGNTNQR
ncbi:MAG: CvpA family protein [Rhodospirillaceae bacterium]|nr:CvpA family protein [Rhodospirillaceae bacterium]